MLTGSPTLDQQRCFWNGWDQKYLQTLSRQALRRGDAALFLVQSLNLDQPCILEVGCGNGWLSEKLAEFGRVTGVDIADAAIGEARRRVPNGTFFAEDFCSLDLPLARFDVVLTLQTLSHVLNQAEFLRRLAAVLKPKGHLIMTTQNRVVFSRRSDVVPQEVGQIRRWVTMAQLRAMLAPHFDVLRAFTIQPSGDMGFLRVVNSVRINAVLSLVISRSKLESLKERAGLGETLVISAQRR